MNCCCYISINQHKIKIFGYPIKNIGKTSSGNPTKQIKHDWYWRHPKPTYQLRRVGIKYAIASKRVHKIYIDIWWQWPTQRHRQKKQIQSALKTQCMAYFWKAGVQGFEIRHRHVILWWQIQSEFFRIRIKEKDQIRKKDQEQCSGSRIWIIFRVNIFTLLATALMGSSFNQTGSDKN